jgi:hypothetical protein
LLSILSPPLSTLKYALSPPHTVVSFSAFS